MTHKAAGARVTSNRVAELRAELAAAESRHVERVERLERRLDDRDDLTLRLTRALAAACLAVLNGERSRTTDTREEPA